MSEAKQPASGMMAAADRAGGEIERGMDMIEQRAAERPFGSALLGAGLAVGVVAGGLGAFGVVFVVLVKVFA